MSEYPLTTRKVVLRSRPAGLIDDGDIELVTESVPRLAERQTLVRTHLIAMDPVTRLMLNEDIGLLPPIEIGAAVRSFGAGVVARSADPTLPVGAKVTGFFEWADWQIVGPDPGAQLLPDQATLDAGLNVYGHTAMAAYFGMIDVGNVQAGETVVVSGAAGAVGSVAGQLARVHGARVIGIAGGEAKRRWLLDGLHFHDAVDYRTSGWVQQLAATVPGSIDIFFDNVGGEILQKVLPLMAPDGRVISCGASSQYTTAHSLPPAPNDSEVPILVFNAMDYIPQFGQAAERMLQLQQDARLTFDQTMVAGLTQAPDALNMLFDGRSRGRVIVDILA